MNNPMKYVLAAGVGYVLCSALNRNKPEAPKVYKPTTITDETLTSKMVSTMATHLLQKFLWPDKPEKRYMHTYDAGYPRGDKK